MKGATLEVDLFLPDSQIGKLGPMTLRADLKDRALPAETYSKAGVYKYTHVIPPELLQDSTCSIVFTFDKSIRERGSEGRELAAVVNEIALKESEPPKKYNHS